MKRSGLYHKISKIGLLLHNALILGYIVSRLGLSPDPKKVQDIQNAKPPKNLKALTGFLGSVNYLRKYIPPCAQKQEPLLELLRKGKYFKMNKRRIKCFNKLKQSIADATLLTYPRGSHNVTIICNTSQTAIGAILL